MAKLALRDKTYKNYTGGFNDTVTDYNIQDDELRNALNCNIKKAVGGLSSRKGTDKINETSLNGNITRRYEYFLRLTSRKVHVKDKEVFFDGNSTPLLTVDIDRPHFLQNRDVLYISDNTSLYEYGQKDYFSQIGEVDIVTGDIIQVTDEHPQTLLHDDFFQAKSDLGTTDLSTVDYTVSADWEPVTDISGVISSVMRPVDPFDPSKAETFTIEVFDPCTLTGSVTITANGIDTSVAVSSGDTLNTVASKINAASYPGYTTSVNQNVVTFTADASEFRVNAVFQPYSTGVSAVVDVVINGEDNNNILGEDVYKCQRIILHSKSLRYVASGNPDNPTAVYFSEPGQINYFKSTNLLVPTSSDGEVRAMFNILNSVLVSYNRTWWEYTGTDPETDGTWKQLPIPFGCESEWTIQILGYYNFIYLAKDGLYLVSANILSQEGVPTQNTDALQNLSSTKVDNTIESITDKSKCVGIFANDIYFLAYNDDDTEPSNNKVLCYFEDFRSFTFYNGWIVNDFLLNSDGIVEIASRNFNLTTESDTYYDIDVDTGNTKGIDFDIKSARLTLGYNENPKWFDKFFFHFVQTLDPDQGEVTLTIRIGESLQTFEEINITPNLVWGREWGNIWGFEPLFYYMGYIRRKGTWIEYEISATVLGSPIEFYGITAQYQVMRKHNNAYLGTPTDYVAPDPIPSDGSGWEDGLGWIDSEGWID